MDSLFKHCTFDNPIFKSALFWTTLLFISGAFTIYYKIQEANERNAKPEIEQPTVTKKSTKQSQTKPQNTQKAESKPKVTNEEVKPTAVTMPAAKKSTENKQKDTKLQQTPKKTEVLAEKS